LPAVEALKKVVEPATVSGPEFMNWTLLSIVCVFSEVFAIPGPLIVSVFPLVSIVNGFAPGSKLMPAAVILVLSVTYWVGSPLPRKCATLPCTQVPFAGEVIEELHAKDPENVLVVQVPLPAFAGSVSALPAQNNGGRVWLQTFGSTLKNIRMVTSPTTMPRKFLTNRAVNLIRCVFMGMAVDG